MSGFGYSDWSYDPFEKMVIFPPDPLIVIDTESFGISVRIAAISVKRSAVAGSESVGIL